MKITKIRVKNFRLLKDATLNLKDDLSLLIGKNNSGKTSFVVVLERFFDDGTFDFNDFSLCQREKILNLSNLTSDSDLKIQLILQVQYSATDDLSNLSEYILDIDESIDTINMVFECKVDKAKLLSRLNLVDASDKNKYIAKNLNRYLTHNFFVFEDSKNFDLTDDTLLIKKDSSTFKKLVNLQVIHAKRDVASSDARKGVKVLSNLTAKFFELNSEESKDGFRSINTTMSEMDDGLSAAYSNLFEPFLRNAKTFLSLNNLKVVSDLRSNELVSFASKVVYGEENNLLPEHLNGLGFMNILYLLLQIEMKKDEIAKEGKLINILIIEEPEAHTHPQMQYIFASKIKEIIGNIENLQTLITTHSSHIVSQCDFKDIRYLQKIEDQNVKIKDFYEELKGNYEEQKEFNFLVQYLTLQSSELFFADKIIFIEGVSERILLTYFMNEYDDKNEDDKAIRLTAQHISVMEVGANARAFAPFLNFLGTKTLIVTDLDSTEQVSKLNSKGDSIVSFDACCVEKSTNTSNYTLKHFFDAPELNEPTFSSWFQELKVNALTVEPSWIHIAYQTVEDGYHARSFEDAFLHVNKEKIKTVLSQLSGLKNKDLFEENNLSTYELSNSVIAKKSDFASSLLYIAFVGDEGNDVEWKAPKYIKDALSWLAK